MEAFKNISEIIPYSSPEEEVADIIRLCNASKDCLYFYNGSLDHRSKIMILQALTSARDFISDITGVPGNLVMEAKHNESV